MILLLDTTVMIDALRNRRGRANFLDRLFLSGHSLATSAINIGEVYGGLRIGEELKTSAFLQQLFVYPLTQEIAQRAGLLKSSAARNGRTYALDDMFLAATSIQYRLMILTDNRKHFDLPELTLFPMP